MGTSSYAREVAAIAASSGYSVVGFIKKDGDLAQSNLSIIGTDEKISEIIGDFNLSQIHIAVGDVTLRQIIALKMGSIPYGKLIHTNAMMMSESIGDGTIVYPGVIVMTDCNIGRHCLINGRAYLGHDVSIGDFCNIAPSVSIGGHVSVGTGTSIGIGASIKDGIQIGAGVTVGAGAVVVKDIPDNVVSYGNPSRVMS